jgi:hypothetical protein
MFFIHLYYIVIITFYNIHLISIRYLILYYFINYGPLYIRLAFIVSINTSTDFFILVSFPMAIR